MDVKLIERFQYLARDHGSGMLRHADMFGQAAAAGIADNARIAELTAERDGWNTMVRDMSLEIGRRLGERDAALARVAEWRDHIIESGETFGLMAAVLHEFDAERFAQEIAVAELFLQSARALLEGSKP